MNLLYNDIRNDILKKLENLRSKKEIGSSTECGAVIEYCGGIHNIDVRDQKVLLNEDHLREIFKLSDVKVTVLLNRLNKTTVVDYDIHVYILKGEIVQCPRCQLYRGNNLNYDNLCYRCVRVLKNGWIKGLWRENQSVIDFAKYYKI